MKVIICGGRDYLLTEEDEAWLIQKLKELRATEVVSGGANGADAQGERIAKSLGLSVRIFEAEWNIYGRAAGPLRNIDMANYANAVIAFPGGRGTAHMVSTAIKKGLKVYKP